MNQTIKKNALRLLFYFALAALIISLGSPMIESININYICDNDRMKMHFVKTSLLTFKSDLGFLPFAGTDENDPEAYFTSKEAGLGFEDATNCLMTSKSDFFHRMGLSEEKYLKQWKGPYLDTSASDYFLDGFGNPIIYLCWNKAIYLWSAGDDGKFDFSINLDTNTGKTHGKIPEGQADDIVVKVCELRQPKPSSQIPRDRILAIQASLPKKPD